MSTSMSSLPKRTPYIPAAVLIPAPAYMISHVSAYVPTLDLRAITHHHDDVHHLSIFDQLREMRQLRFRPTLLAQLIQPSSLDSRRSHVAPHAFEEGHRRFRSRRRGEVVLGRSEGV